MGEIKTVEFVFVLLLFFIVVFGVLARKLGTAYPIVMVLGGLLLSFVPGVPSVTLDPDLIFLVVMPPLLYASAWDTSWPDFRYNIVTISFLAFGLVIFTVIGVALAAPHVFSGFDWRLGLVLGAVVAPTDAIAATSIARRVGLPSRIVDILEGESLINDATGLLALQFATGILVEEHMPTPIEGLLTMLQLVVGGVAVGLAVGWIVDQFESRINDSAIEITISILVPYATYLAADNLHTSGVLAVVSCGLFLRRRSSRMFSPAVRMGTWSVWQVLTFILNGLVFVLVGLQFPAIRASIRGTSLGTMAVYGAVFSLLLILLRMTWVFPGAQISHFVRRHIGRPHERRPRLRHSFVIGWTGMRGVVSLAAALALPTVLMDGSPFPRRNTILFLTSCVIFVTLVVQGLTLPPLIRTLGLARESGPDYEEVAARQIVTRTALAYLEGAKKRDNRQTAEIYEDLAHHYRQRLASLAANGEEDTASGHTRHLEISLEALRVERETAIRLRNEGRINDAVLKRLEREFDLSESHLSNLEE